MVYRSLDGGQNWEECPQPNLLNFFIGDLVVARDGVIYLGMNFSEGVIRSSDACQTWEDFGLDGETVNTVLQDPVDDDTFYVASFDGFSRTTNGGTDWTRLLEGIFSDVFVNPHDTQELVVRTGASDARQSTDGGASWQDVEMEDVGRTLGMVFDPVNPAVRYLMASFGIYRSIDGGVTWTDHDDGILGGLTDVLQVDPTDPYIQYTRSTIGSLRYPERRWMVGAGNPAGGRFDGYAFSNLSPAPSDLRILDPELPEVAAG